MLEMFLSFIFILQLATPLLPYSVRAAHQHNMRSMSSITGITYRDPLPDRRKDPNDPCNSLYWYPQHVPDYCSRKTKLVDPVVYLPLPCKPPNGCFTTPPPTSPPPPCPCSLPPEKTEQCPATCPPFSISYPAPLVQPPAIPYPVMAPPPPMLMPYPAPPPYPGPLPSYLPSPYAPGPWFPPYPGYGPPPPLPPQPPPVYMPPIITAGVRILPFTDAYSEMIEKQKHKDMIAEMEGVLKRYECAYQNMC